MVLLHLGVHGTGVDRACRHLRRHVNGFRLRLLLHMASMMAVVMRITRAMLSLEFRH